MTTNLKTELVLLPELLDALELSVPIRLPRLDVVDPRRPGITGDEGGYRSDCWQNSLKVVVVQYIGDENNYICGMVTLFFTWTILL